MLYNTEELPTKGTRTILYVLLMTVVFSGTLAIAWGVISTLRYQKYLEKVSDADKVEKVTRGLSVHHSLSLSLRAGHCSLSASTC